MSFAVFCGWSGFVNMQLYQYNLLAFTAKVPIATMEVRKHQVVFPRSLEVEPELWTLMINPVFYSHDWCLHGVVSFDFFSYSHKNWKSYKHTHSHLLSTYICMLYRRH